MSLTKKDIDYIISNFDHPKNSVSDFCLKPIIENIKYDLKNVKIPKEKKQEYINNVIDHFHKSLAQKGDMVGLQSAIALGEPVMQLTMNTFHSAGVASKDIASGVPRFNELMNVTKDPSTPSMTVYISDEQLKNYYKCLKNIKKYESEGGVVNSDIKISIRKEIFNSLSSFAEQLKEVNISWYLASNGIKLERGEEITSNAYVSDYDNYTNYKIYNPEWWVEEYAKMYNKDLSEYPCEKWVVKLDLDLFKLFSHNISTFDISHKIEQICDGYIKCIPSPNIIHQINVYFSFNSLIQKNKKECLPYFIARDVFSKWLSSFPLKGVKGIKDVYITELKNDQEEWVIETSGINTIDVMSLDFIDSTRSICDDVREIYSLFGIEAANIFLQLEFTRLLGFDGTYINPRHVQTLANKMTCLGILTAVSKNGISREEGPLPKIMFEESVKNSAISGIFGEVDNINSVLSGIYCGRRPSIGTETTHIINQQKKIDLN